MKNKFPAVALMAISLTLVGCSSAPVIVKTYAGENPGQQAKAVVKPASFIGVVSIDNQPYKIYPSHEFLNGEYEFDMLPGEHTFELSFGNGGASSTRNLNLVKLLEPGKRYLLKPEVNGNSWRPKLIDVTAKPECWTFKVGTTFGPNGCD